MFKSSDEKSPIESYSALADTLAFMWSLVGVIWIQLFSCIGISQMRITGLAFSG